MCDYNWGAPAVAIANRKITDDGSYVQEFFMPIADGAEQPKNLLPRIFRHERPSHNRANFSYGGAPASTQSHVPYTSFCLSFGGR